MSDGSHPTRSQPPAHITNPDHLIRVEDGLLVVPSGCVLPPICIRTNQPVSANDLILTNLFWSPPAVLPLYLLLGPIAALHAQFLAHEMCEITYALSPSIWRWAVFRRVVCSVLAIAFFVAMAFLAAANFSPWLFVPPGILFVVALIGAVAGPAHLSIVKCRNGMYWIKGFRPDYLSQLPLEA
jgi:hypothetical protein